MNREPYSTLSYSSIHLHLTLHDSQFMLQKLQIYYATKIIQFLEMNLLLLPTVLVT